MNSFIVSSSKVRGALKLFHYRRAIGLLSNVNLLFIDIILNNYILEQIGKRLPVTIAKGLAWNVLGAAIGAHTEF